MAKQATLTPMQKEVKHPRPVRYDGPHQNFTHDQGRDIIELYVVAKLGYSPIRHIMKYPSDKPIENVIRQHGLGRNKVKGEKGELFCPGSKTLSSKARKIIIDIAAKYDTLQEEYVEKMLADGKWYDDPVKFLPKVCDCGKPLQPDWNCCPYCLHKFR